MPRPVRGGTVTALYGPTNEPLDRGGYNKGLDIGVPEGTDVEAVVDGTVIQAGYAPDGWGISVKVRDRDGYVHNYGHMSAVGVAVGQTVGEGERLGASGNTGASTGPHVSYDVLSPEGYYVDPSPWLGFNAAGDNRAGGTVGEQMAEPDWTGMADQIATILEELSNQRPDSSDPAYQLPANLGGGFDADSYRRSINAWAQSYATVAGLAKTLKAEALGLAELPDGTVMPIGSASSEQLAQIRTANQNVYRDLLNKFGLSQWSLLDTATQRGNQNVLDRFNANVRRFESGLAGQETDLARANAELTRWLGGQQLASQDAGRIQEAKREAVKYGTTPGKSAFTGTDLGGAVSMLARQAGLNPDEVLIRYPGTQTFTPTADRMAAASAMGISSAPPVSPGANPAYQLDIPGAPSLAGMIAPPPQMPPQAYAPGAGPSPAAPPLIADVDRAWQGRGRGWVE